MIAPLTLAAHSLDALKSESALMSTKKTSDDELGRFATTALSAETLSRPLVDLLIEKVYVYPDSRIEIQ